jgi:hypothetical protein
MRDGTSAAKPAATACALELSGEWAQAQLEERGANARGSAR